MFIHYMVIDCMTIVFKVTELYLLAIVVSRVWLWVLWDRICENFLFVVEMFRGIYGKQEGGHNFLFKIV